MTSPYLLIEDSLAEGGSGVEDKSFKNIKPGGYVRSGLASLGISFWNKFSGDSWFFRKSPWEQVPFISSRTELLLGEGNDTPLQYSCLNNSMDGGAW